MTLLQELIAFGRRGNAEVIFDQDANELVFLCNAWDRDGYGYHLWEENGLWSVGRSSRYRNFKNPSTDLSTPDFDIALRWLIHKVGSTARTELRMHPLKVPVNGGIHNEHIAPGWRYEYANGNYVDLYTPQGQLLPVTMTDSPPTVATDAVKLSHLMGFTPEQLLASYQDPYGRPHLTRYLHEDKRYITSYFPPLPATIPPTDPLEELTFFTRRGGASVATYPDTNDTVFTDGNLHRHHFWYDNNQWHYGTSYRGNPDRNDPPIPRTALLSTPDRDIALRWLIHETMNKRRLGLRMHPLTLPTHLAPGWTTTINHSPTGTLTGHLTTPEGTPLDMTMTLTSIDAPELATLSHLMTHTPQELITSIQDPYARPHLTPYLHQDPHLTDIGLPLPTPIPPLEHA